MEGSTAITAGFGVLFVGVIIMIAGVFLGGELTFVGAGAVLMVLSVGGFVFGAFEDGGGDTQAGTH